MNARDELAEVVSNGLAAVAGIFDTSGDEDRCIADTILAAGYRKPRAITTTEELDALPNGAVVLSDGYLIAFQRRPNGDWHRGGRAGSTHPDIFLPATVLHEGA